MISYDKLRNLLKSRGIGIREFFDNYKVDVSRIILGQIIPETDTIEQICAALNCDIDDIMEYTERKPAASGLVYINYDKLGSLMAAKGITKYRLSKMMGKKNTFIGDKFLLKNALRSVDLDKLLSALECSLEDIQ